MARPAKLIPNLLWHSARKQYYIRVKREFTYLGSDFEAAQRQYLAIVNHLTDARINPPIDPRCSEPIPSQERKRSSVVRRVLDVNDLTVSEALLEYIKYLKEAGADPRKLHRISTVFRLLAKDYGSTLANDFRAKKLKVFREYLLTVKSKRQRKEYGEDERGRDYSLPETANGGTLSRQYINHLVSALLLAFDWLSSEELVHPATVDVLRTVKPLLAGEKVKESLRVVPVAREAVEATLMECSAVVRAMILCQLHTGCRPGEICRIRRGDVSISADEKILIPNTTLRVSAVTVDGVPVWIYVPPKHKGSWRNKPRAILLGPRAQEAIAPFLDRNPNEYLFTTGRRGSSQRVPYTTHGLGTYISRVIFRVNKRREADNVKRAERGESPLPMVPHWQPNQLRHYTATEVKELFGRKEAANYLGHSGTDTIDDYAEQAIRSAARIAKELG